MADHVLRFARISSHIHNHFGFFFFYRAVIICHCRRISLIIFVVQTGIFVRVIHIPLIPASVGDDDWLDYCSWRAHFFRTHNDAPSLLRDIDLLIFVLADLKEKAKPFPFSFFKTKFSVIRFRYFRRRYADNNDGRCERRCLWGLRGFGSFEF